MLGIIRIITAGIALQFGIAAVAQDGYPNRPIRLIVPYGPGATTDLMARAVGHKLSEALGQSVVIDNRAGGGGVIGSDLVAKAPADGYTLLIATDGTHTGNPFLLKRIPFDAIKDFTPITLAAKNLLVLVANPALPVSNVKDLIEHAKANPKALSYGSSGNGSPHHLAGIVFNQMAGTSIQHIAYKGGGQAVADVLGGQIPLAYASLATVVSHIRSGKLKALAITEKTRVPEFADLPAMAETLPGFEMGSWLGFMGPANLPADVLKRLSSAMVKALTAPDMAAEFNKGGLLVVASTPEEFASRLKAEYEERGRLIRQNHIEGD
jgi:tripartite-type tricarboxylate transporter receptor subunit TctC